MKLSRRKWLFRSILLAPPTAFGYGSTIEKNWIDVNRVDIPLAPHHRHLHGLRIALMSDFHHDEFGDDEFIRRAVHHINDERVDVVMLAGDYISNHVPAMEPLCAELARLRAGKGVFSIIGNHDRWHYDEAIPRMFEDAGIRLLVNEAADFGEFAVGGADSCWGGNPRLPAIEAQLPKDMPILLGWHEPDTFDRYENPQYVLQMSGHTHGGQVCAPVYGPILLPSHGQKYPFGHYQDGYRNLYVTRGIGTMDVPTRFLCRPEVAILRLVDQTLSIPDER